MGWLIGMRRYVQLFHILAFVFAAWESQAQTNEIIYSNSLQNGWANWSWNSTINFAATSPAPPVGTDSISVTSENYGALYLNVSGTTELNSSLYTNLTFWLNGGSSGGQVLTVAATLTGNAQAETVTVGPLAVNTWTQYTISLASLGVANEPELDGFWLQINTANTVPTYYVADMMLVGAPPAPPGRAESNQFYWHRCGSKSPRDQPDDLRHGFCHLQSIGGFGFHHEPIGRKRRNDL